MPNSPATHYLLQGLKLALLASVLVYNMHYVAVFLHCQGRWNPTENSDEQRSLGGYQIR